MRLTIIASHVIDGQRGHLFPWAPVLFGTGIAIYFAIKSEPTGQLLLIGLSGTLIAAAVALRFGPLVQILTAAIILISLGFHVAAWRAHSVAAPVLKYRYYGPIEGRIVNIDRSQSDAPRYTLDQVVLYNTSPTRTPARIRISQHGSFEPPNVVPGDVIILTGHLSPPTGPVEPGGFDFQRQAWFQSLGAVGYTRTPVLIYERARPGGLWLWITKLRLSISQEVQRALPGRAGAFAAAITTGDRSGMDQKTLEDLRASNLAHLLAISGLHMGLLTGFVFAASRYGLAAIPTLALRWPVKKIGAVVALVAGAIYLALSGGNVATERAYIMVSTMFCAVLLDRRAITLRAVALAALVVLTLRPETLLGPGFQMSFSATIALVAAFGWMRDRDWSQSRWPWWLRTIGGVAISSAVAGFATAPIAAVHFNQIPHYGLIANILSVPLMGAIIIPAAVLAGLLAPLGGHELGLALMAPPINWILNVADTVGHLPGALTFVWSPQGTVLPLLAVAGLWLALWQGRARTLAILPTMLAVTLWTQTTRPDVLISANGALVGALSTEGRVLSKPRGDGFSALSWLENDGDPVLQTVAAARAGITELNGVRRLQLGDTSLLHATGKRATAQAVESCTEGAVLFTNTDAPPTEYCVTFDARRLRDTGSVAIYLRKDGTIEFQTARARQGARLWSQ